MSLKMTSKGGTDFPRCPVGTTLGICYGVIDVGMQPNQNYGPKASILLLFETPNELMPDGRPFGVSKTYGASMSPKSWLRKDVEVWLGVSFDSDAAAYNYDVTELLGQPCLLTISESKAKNGDRIWTNVDAVVKVMKGMTIPAQVNPSLLYDMDNPDQSVYDKLPQWIRNKIDAGRAYHAEQDDDGQGYGKHDDAPLTDFEDSPLPF